MVRNWLGICLGDRMVEDGLSSLQHCYFLFFLVSFPKLIYFISYTTSFYHIISNSSYVQDITCP